MISWFKNWYTRLPGLLDDLHQLLYQWMKLTTTFIFLSSFFYSCSNTKFLAEDEKLYTRTSFSQQGIGKINDKALKAFSIYSTTSIVLGK